MHTIISKELLSAVFDKEITELNIVKLAKVKY